MKHLVYELGLGGQEARLPQLTDYTADRVRTCIRTHPIFAGTGLTPNAGQRSSIASWNRVSTWKPLAEAAGRPEADPFDLLCHLAFHAPLRTRRERAERLKQEETAFLEQYVPAAREVLGAMLDKYAEHGSVQFKLPDILEIPPISEWETSSRSRTGSAAFRT